MGLCICLVVARCNTGHFVLAGHFWHGFGKDTFSTLQHMFVICLLKCLGYLPLLPISSTTIHTLGVDTGHTGQLILQCVLPRYKVSGAIRRSSSRQQIRTDTIVWKRNDLDVAGLVFNRLAGMGWNPDYDNIPGIMMAIPKYYTCC